MGSKSNTDLTKISNLKFQIPNPPPIFATPISSFFARRSPIAIGITKAGDGNSAFAKGPGGRWMNLGDQVDNRTVA